MEPIKVDFSEKSANKGKKEVYIPPDKVGLKIFLNCIITIVFAAVLYYFMLPPMNLKDINCYIYFGLVLASYVGATVLTSKAASRTEYMPYVRRQSIVPIVLAGVLLVILIGGGLSSAALFRSRSYAKILSVDTENFSSSMTAIDSLEGFNNIPLIDADAAATLADKTLGDLASMGLESQFVVNNSYSTQINFQGAPVRVFPLSYGNIFKWIKNVNDGTPGYVIVNMNTQQASFKVVTDGIKYSPAEHFNRLLKRVLRFKYPTYIFGTCSFEIDDNGTPYWICEHLDKKVGLVGGDDVVGIVLVNAITGECNYYTSEECAAGVSADGTQLEWMDQIYDADLLDKQYNFLGKYANGFFNSFIFQKEVKSTTAGYSYLAIDDDVYMYTGITSVTSDNSIVGFLLVNQRTKKASFYPQTGATESAAQQSAQGIVSDKGWTATFPLLINLDGEATYFMALKDSSNIIKSYAMVNVAQYSDAVRSPSDDDPDIAACLSAYISKLAARNINLNIDMNGELNVDKTTPTDTAETKTVSETGKAAEIRSAVISGNTIFYIRLEGDTYFFSVSASDCPNAVIFNPGDLLVVRYAQSNLSIRPASSVVLSGSIEDTTAK